MEALIPRKGREMAKIDLSSLGRQGLARLKRQIERELAARERFTQRIAQRGASNDPTPRRPIVYRHPGDPGKGWSGRGGKPRWLKEWEAQGRSLEDLRDR